MCNSLLFYAFMMAVAIAFHSENAVKAIQVQNHRNKRNLNCCYSIFTKKHNSQGHFRYIKTSEEGIKSRNES